MLVSVEVPVFKHHFLKETIESVISQSYDNWILILLSDGATSQAREIMEEYEGEKIKIYFQENSGICKTRKKLSSLSNSDLILPLDHDDILFPSALEEMVQCFKENPQAGIVRAKRVFIDENTNELQEKEWFPFGKRQHFEGMTMDVHNHSQPAMMRRTAYNKTLGWEGFSEFSGAGGDCDMFLKIEEVADIVLLDKVLYGYRINPERFSLDLGMEGAVKMWTALADKTIVRRNLKLKRLNKFPPFIYEKTE